MRFSRPAHEKFISVAAASFAETPGVSFAQPHERLRGPHERLRQARNIAVGERRIVVRLARSGADQTRHERNDLVPHHRDLGGERLPVRTCLPVQHRPAVRVLRGVGEERP